MTSDGLANGTANGTVPEEPAPLSCVSARADEVQDLLQALLEEVVPFIRAADDDPFVRPGGGAAGRTALLEQHAPKELQSLLDDSLRLPARGLGRDGLLDIVRRVLRFSVNPWSQGFMDKLYASTNAVGLLSELLLATLNSNVHVWKSSPALSLIEKSTGKHLAALFGLTGPDAGGISQPGGSASNSSSIVIARNTLYPDTKEHGNGDRRFVLFTSAHGHYSVEKAAQMFGFGSKAVIPVEVDEQGRMKPAALDKAIAKSKDEGKTPFYVNATAGTTVLGSFDPFSAIADVCQKHGLWLHVDGSWGGSVIFSQRLAFDEGRLRGVERADSIAVTPHKMLGVPLTCPFLLGRDMRRFWRAMTLPAGYLFHNEIKDPSFDDMHDLADLTPQCGRKGDSLKMFLSWQYYGAEHYRNVIERAFDTADYLYGLLEKHPNFILVSRRPLPCLQVCFYFARSGALSNDVESNTRTTAAIAQALVLKGFMVDYAPGDRGKFFRVVVNSNTRRETLESLVGAVDRLGTEFLDNASNGT